MASVAVTYKTWTKSCTLMELHIQKPKEVFDSFANAKFPAQPKLTTHSTRALTFKLTNYTRRHGRPNHDLTIRSAIVSRPSS